MGSPFIVFNQFLIGVFAAEALLYLPRDECIPRSFAFPFIADASFITALGLWWVLPYFVKAEALRHPEGFFVNGYMCLWAAYVFASCLGHRGLIARLTENKLMSLIGEYSFEIYCFQYPVFTYIKDWRNNNNDAAHGYERYERVPFEEWTFCLIVLIFVSVVFAELIEFPYVNWLRHFCNKWGGVPEKREVETVILDKGAEEEKPEAKTKIAPRRTPARSDLPEDLDPLLGV